MGISSSLGSSALLPAGLGFRNKIINGDMRVAQRGTAAVTGSSTAQYPVDRWIALSQTSNTITFQQSTVAPPGFSNSVRVTVTSGGSAYTASQYTFLYQKIEGFNTVDLAYGTSSAKLVTISFWAQSSVTGNYSAVLENSAGTQNYVAPFTISAANTWEFKTIQIPGATSGTWLTDSNTGLTFYIVLGAGSTFDTTANTWVSGKYSVSGHVDIGATNGATFTVTGVQLEQNYQPTPFEQLPVGVELALCQRYYQQFTSTVGDNSFCTGVLYLSTLFLGALSWSPMRAAPIVAFSGSFNLVAAGLANSCTPGSGNITATSCQISGTVTGYTAGNGGTMRMASGAFYSLNAEL
jgi:hypothetical protein